MSSTATAGRRVKDLERHLSDVFRTQARFCVLIISKSYATKYWPQVELHAALAPAVVQADEYVIPVRLDGTAIPGIGDNIAYLDASQQTVGNIVSVLMEKLAALNASSPAA